MHEDHDDDTCEVCKVIGLIAEAIAADADVGVVLDALLSMVGATDATYLIPGHEKDFCKHVSKQLLSGIRAAGEHLAALKQPN